MRISDRIANKWSTWRVGLRFAPSELAACANDSKSGFKRNKNIAHPGILIPCQGCTQEKTTQNQMETT